MSWVVRNGSLFQIDTGQGPSRLYRGSCPVDVMFGESHEQGRCLGECKWGKPPNSHTVFPVHCSTAIGPMSKVRVRRTDNGD